MLVRNGMRTVQLIGVPPDAPPTPDAHPSRPGEPTTPSRRAIVVALKSRTIPAARGRRPEPRGPRTGSSRAGCRQFLFKYCSTFDSTDDGNIGPVADALVDALGCGFAIACPAFPANGRTVFQGHLFVGTTCSSATAA